MAAGTDVGTPKLARWDVNCEPAEPYPTRNGRGILPGRVDSTSRGVRFSTRPVIANHCPTYAEWRPGIHVIFLSHPRLQSEDPSKVKIYPSCILRDEPQRQLNKHAAQAFLGGVFTSLDKIFFLSNLSLGQGLYLKSARLFRPLRHYVRGSPV